jgi:hypothetical protein
MERAYKGCLEQLTLIAYLHGYAIGYRFFILPFPERKVLRGSLHLQKCYHKSWSNRLRNFSCVIVSYDCGSSFEGSGLSAKGIGFSSPYLL